MEPRWRQNLGTCICGMEWRIRIHRKALKFLEKLQEHERKRIVEKLVNVPPSHLLTTYGIPHFSAAS